MVKDFDKKLRSYAELIVRVGVNVQKGQTVKLVCSVDRADLARVLVEEAYKAGAGDVVVVWRDDFMTRARYLNADGSVFDGIHAWDKLMIDSLADRRAAHINVVCEDPKNLEGVDPDRVKRYLKAYGENMRDYREKVMSDYFPWVVVAAPTDKWAQSVFPDLAVSKAVDKLWDAIFKATRCDRGNAVDKWQKHIRLMRRRANKLNSLKLKSLHYTNALGTDLVIELPEGHEWIACGNKAGNGVEFVANMPTEEIFTLPVKTGVNGRAVASKALVIDGNLIEDFSFTFKDGKIVETAARAGLEVLKNSIGLDEGASYLGEVALVPYKSPISDTGILFYNTLFDENAACHLAYGAAYPCFKNKKMSKEEMVKRGMNDSITHNDFMIGTADLSITGTTKDGKKVEIFRDGNFAI